MTSDIGGGQSLSGEEIVKLSDRELHAKCQVCGSNIRKLQKEFACYLPEVERRSLHKKYGFHSVYEYAGRLAGMNHATVDSIISVHKKLVDKPVLKDLMADLGWGKLKVVAAVATPENQGFWAEKIKGMSKATLVTYMRELRRQEGQQGAEEGVQARAGAAIPKNGSSQTGLFTDSGNESQFGTGSGTPADASQKAAITFRLAAEIEIKLRIFKQKLEKKTREPKDWNEVIKELLKIAEEHESCGKEPGKSHEEGLKKQQKERRVVPGNAVTRHIPAHVKKQLQQKYGGSCAFPGCKNPAEINHHTKRFVLKRGHDSTSITPLCKNHERIAHHGLIGQEDWTPENWEILREPDRSSPKYAVDRIVQKYRAPE